MTASQSLKRNLQCGILRVSLDILVFQLGCNVNTASASYDKLAPCLGVEVQQNVGIEDVLRQSVGSEHACLLIGCDESLYWSVLQVLSLHYGHDGCNADAVVCAEGCTLCPYPFAVNVCLDGVVLKVVCALGRLLWHHVHVCLQQYGLAVFHAWCGWFAHNDVVGLVLEGFHSSLLGEVEQELLYFLQVSRWTWHLCERMEVAPDALRL